MFDSPPFPRWTGHLLKTGLPSVRLVGREDGLLLHCGGFGFRAPNWNQLADDQIFLREALFPALECLQLLRVQILEIIERTVQVLGQHVLVEAAMCQASACVSSSKVGIGAARTVEVSPRRHIENTSTNGEIHRHAIQAIIWEQVRRGEGAEDGGRRSARKHLRRGRLETEIDQEDEEREEEDVDGRRRRSSGYASAGRHRGKADAAYA